MRVRIKICCIASIRDAEMAVRAGADALGLVGDMPSGPGVIDDALARDIAARVPPPVTTFLLTQRTSAADIADHVRFCGTGAVQVVNHIEPGELARLAEMVPSSVRRVQVIHVEGGAALDLIEDYASHVSAFLLDSGKPSAEVPELGGTGRVHDWQVSAEFVRRSPVPVFLAGGLTGDNVAEAVARVRPFGVDVCSGVRSADQLDGAKLDAFIAAARG